MSHRCFQQAPSQPLVTAVEIVVVLQSQSWVILKTGLLALPKLDRFLTCGWVIKVHNDTARACQNESILGNINFIPIVSPSRLLSDKTSLLAAGMVRKKVLTVRNSGGWKKSATRGEVEKVLEETAVWEDPRMTHATVQISWSGLFCKHKATTLCRSVSSFTTKAFDLLHDFPNHICTAMFHQSLQHCKLRSLLMSLTVWYLLVGLRMHSLTLDEQTVAKQMLSFPSAC